MICCKIIAKFDDQKGKFNELLEIISKYGALLFENDCLYYGSDEKEMTEKFLKESLRSCGYKQFVIFKYDLNSVPEEGSSINGWLLDWLVKIQRNLIEDAEQENFRELSAKMDKLQTEIDTEIKKLDKKIKEDKKNKKTHGGK